MRLNRETIKDRAAWEKIGVRPPYFDLDEVEKNTKEQPKWVHFGGGNIFRGFVAAVLQNLLEEGKEDTGINVIELFDYEVIDKVYKPYDNLSIAVTIKPDGDFEKRIIASVMEALKGDPLHPDWERAKEIFRNPSLQLASLTITEKGYNIEDQAGNLFPQVMEDMKNGPVSPQTSMGKVAALLYERFKAGRLPIALLSLDNFSRNGEKLYSSVKRISEEWVKNGLVEKDFIDYLEKDVAFPWSMIDKIVPGPSEFIKEHLEKLGIGGMEIFVTSKRTHIAPFVNMEWAQYLVIEDSFPNGRPKLEGADRNVFLTDRETVEKAERMKVTTCLNPLHTALAIFGCLLGYKKIADEMKDPLLKKLVEGVGEEGIKVVVDPGIINPREFLNEVINIRLPNPYLPDTPQRIATDTSQKMPIRFGETIKAYHERPDLDPRDLKYIPLVIAGWCRYLMGIDDEGKEMQLSPDPLLENLRSYVSKIKFGDPESTDDHLKPILSSQQLFRVNLYEVGLGEKIEELFKKMITGPRAVRKTLEEVVGRENE
ncbi:MULTISPECIES: D-mannonate dehydrogenase UxuB [unclassified Thermotoga]|uniref:D-mannonate dehydrogenase UxuB n=1 Tax=unclassified Thermotoga TaxID=2631113 RepID=UPI0003FAE9CF|nr:MULTISPECIES: D-mannonate dehydrogenase UxuB [unclassified Thermotoga]AIY88191.1 mannitol dehydrogenase domain-containing protein [Thermotoga sp. Cell2]KHC90593.1 mannitol dehydrogenase domain-containing protein [Thermotoga sp. TBGT1765]KHC90942.1 mannitol dehydrogenase domain-containing protein [Thermotoga sp. TBGT1766]KHC96866.1 mannitol dehydrogenase domain-containing protein [Thermotoga sp. Xyl54]